MFEKQNYEERLAIWRDFRESLNESKDPVQDVINFYSTASTVRMHTDPYDMNSWPDPWELLEENIYCNYCILLGICYTLQLSGCFKGEPAEIHIGINREKSDTWYLLKIANTIIGYESNDEYIRTMELPENLHIQKIHYLASRQ